MIDVNVIFIQQTRGYCGYVVSVDNYLKQTVSYVYDLWPLHLISNVSSTLGSSLNLAFNIKSVVEH